MKKIFYTIAGALLLGLGSCDSLDLAPIDYAATGNFWQNESEVTTFMYGLHGQLRSDYQSLLNLGELRGGAMVDGTSSINTSLNSSSIIVSNLTTSSTGISNWNGYYGRLLQVNHFIEQLTNECAFLSDASRKTFLAQAHGLRAYYYFMLYRTFGAVPLEKDVKVMSGSIDVVSLYMARSSAEDVLQFIKDEIKASEEGFAGNSAFDCYTWSALTTQFLKAQVYLWSAKVSTNDYEKPHQATGTADLNVAKEALDKIISSGKFGLQEHFADIFDYKKKKNNEIILAMPCDFNEYTNWGVNFVYTPSIVVGSYYAPDGNKMVDVLELGTAGIVRYEWKESLVKSMDLTDSRRAATFLEYYQDEALTKFGCSMLKLIGHMESGIRQWDSDVIMYRYADVLLMRAEVENGLTGKCASYINQIRERAYGDNFSDEVKYVDGSFAENELAILHERDKEFVSEGCRWFDVVRLQDANKQPLVFSAEAAYPKVYGEAAYPVLDKATEQHKLLWPVNVSTLTADPELKQTWGYNEAEGK